MYVWIVYLYASIGWLTLYTIRYISTFFVDIDDNYFIKKFEIVNFPFKQTCHSSAFNTKLLTLACYLMCDGTTDDLGPFYWRD